jgi:hypothetical protein
MKRQFIPLSCCCGGDTHSLSCYCFYKFLSVPPYGLERLQSTPANPVFSRRPTKLPLMQPQKPRTISHIQQMAVNSSPSGRQQRVFSCVRSRYAAPLAGICLLAVILYATVHSKASQISGVFPFAGHPFAGIQQATSGLRSGSGKDAGVRLLNDHAHDAEGLPVILVLTPVKNAVKHMDNYFRLLRRLSYPHERIAIGLMDSDSDDKPDATLKEEVTALLAAGTIPALPIEPAPESEANAHGHAHELHHSATLYRLLVELPKLQTEFRSVTVFQHNFGLELGRRDRHAMEFQLERRKMLARSRNHLLITALRDEDYVLWLDADVNSYPKGEQWTCSRAFSNFVFCFIFFSFNMPLYLSIADVIESLLSSKKQIVVPNCVMTPGGRSYDLNSWRAGDKTLGNDASLKAVIAYHDSIHATRVAEDAPRHLDVEGYSRSGNVYLHQMRDEGEVVRLDAVGGAMLLVDAELHRHGLMFPPFVYRHRIETEGLSMMALDMGVMVRAPLYFPCFSVLIYSSPCDQPPL